MAESDDEYDRKRRDKFRGERSAGGENYGRSDRRDDRARPDNWGPESRARVRAAPDYRDYRPIRERGYSPGRGEGPPMKRMRGDWGDEGGRPRYGGHDAGYGMYGYAPDPGYMHPTFGGGYNALAHARDAATQLATDMQTQPCMMTLKQYLATQDDSISDSDAIQKYSDYKLDFKRQQLNEFFVAHKDEEWFKIKYHPEESMKRRDEQLSFLKKRVDVFLELLDSGEITKISVDTTNTDQLLRLLDTAVIKLEGGTEEDLKALDEKPQVEMVIKMAPEKPKVEEPPEKEEEIEFTGRGLQSQEEEMWDDDEPAQKVDSPPKTATVEEEDEEGEKEDDESTGKDRRKRARSNSASSSSSSSSSSSDSDENDGKKDEEKKEQDETELIPKSPIDEAAKQLDTIDEISNDKEENIEELEDETEEKKEENEKSTKDDDNNDEAMITDEIAENVEDGEQKDDEDDGEQKDDEDSGEQKDEEEKENDLENGEEKQEENKEDDNKTETIDLVQEPEIEPPRALHKTSSIFLRNLAPSITKAEVEAMCKRYNGFLRVAIADPLLERRWFRRGWVTFQREVNIKEICWNLNNIRLRDCELGAIVNRDLSRRVRPVNGITSHKTIVRSDIKLIAKIAHNLDDKTGLWKDGPINKEQNGSSFGLQSKNPVLHNITDYLIEEASAEEEELLGLTTEGKDNADGEFIDRDPQLITVLDKLIMYLRIVHSVDFYNHCEYPYEDEMPNRCGIIHARGPIPQNRVTQTEIQDYVRTFEGKMQSFLTQSAEVVLEEMKKLGSKDIDAEVEKFIAANTQELAKDKWLCPLSGKKFKGPDFVRKHIFNKHGEKVDEVKKEVEYFNNYLKDPKRPQLPEHPGNTKKQVSEGAQSAGYRPPYGGPGGYAPSYGGYSAPMMAPRPRPAPYSMGRGRMPAQDYRPVIHYRDLDAPASDEYL